jgi:hypothetical protein
MDYGVNKEIRLGKVIKSSKSEALGSPIHLLASSGQKFKRTVSGTTTLSPLNSNNSFLYLQMSTKTAAGCLQLCKNKGGCRWTSHDKNTQTCLLFKDCNHYESLDSNVTTSEINCKEILGKCILQRYTELDREIN